MVLRRAGPAISQLFEFDRLVFSVFVDRRSPDLVRSLVFGAAKTELGSKAQVEIARVLQDVDERLGIELRSSALGRRCGSRSEETHMLAEKFILVLETLISRTNPDGGPRVESTSQQVPIKLPRKSGK
jgi:hypothetical protein